eukprot:9939835-Alexandrium_andersonii.AAC.1
MGPLAASEAAPRARLQLAEACVAKRLRLASGSLLQRLPTAVGARSVVLGLYEPVRCAKEAGSACASYRTRRGVESMPLRTHQFEFIPEPNVCMHTPLI